MKPSGKLHPLHRTTWRAVSKLSDAQIVCLWK